MGGNKAITLEGGLSSSGEICLSLDEVNSDTWDKQFCITTSQMVIVTEKQNQVFPPKLLNRSLHPAATPFPTKLFCPQYKDKHRLPAKYIRDDTFIQNPSSFTGWGKCVEPLKERGRSACGPCVPCILLWSWDHWGPVSRRVPLELHKTHTHPAFSKHLFFYSVSTVMEYHFL